MYVKSIKKNKSKSKKFKWWNYVQGDQIKQKKKHKKVKHKICSRYVLIFLCFLYLKGAI